MRKSLKAASLARWVATLMMCMASAAFVDAKAASTDFSACSRCPGAVLVWSEGDFDQIFLAAPAKDAINQHPKELDAEGLAAVLLKLKRSGEDKAEPLFNSLHARRVADGMAGALAKANSGQDVLFFVTASRGGTGWFAERRGYSGRAYIDDRGLNLIFGGADLDFAGQYHGTKRQPNFDFGSRESASSASLHTSGLSMRRRDWVAIPLTMINRPRPAASHALHGTVAEQAPLTKAAAKDEQYYAAQEMRLRRLKSLMEQELITREEYELKRKSILEEW